MEGVPGCVLRRVVCPGIVASTQDSVWLLLRTWFGRLNGRETEELNEIKGNLQQRYAGCSMNDADGPESHDQADALARTEQPSML